MISTLSMGVLQFVCLILMLLAGKRLHASRQGAWQGRQHDAAQAARRGRPHAGDVEDDMAAPLLVAAG